MNSLPVLSILLLLPVVGGIGILLVGDEKRSKEIALGFSLLVFALSLALFLSSDGRADLQFGEDHVWVGRYDIHYKLGVDGISLSLVLLTAFLTPLAVLCSWTSVSTRVRGFFASLLFLESGMIGVFCAADLFLFYVFWEAMLLPMVLLVGIWGGPRRIYAAVKFVLYTMAGSLLMFVAILYCGIQAGTFDIAILQARLPELPPSIQLWLFAAFALAFAIKVPLFPLHTWLPDAHVEAPTAGSVILAGVLLKMGTYGFLRFAIPFFPEAAVAFASPILALSVIGILYGALMAMAQSDIKKLIAYSSVSHLGFVMLGLFTFDTTAAQGAVLQMLNHGLSSGALFLLVGMIYDRTHRRSLDDFGGLAARMPVYATIFLIITLSSIGVPGLNGFAGEFLILLGSFRHAPITTALAGTGVILGALYLLVLYRRVFFGKITQAPHRELPDANGRELAYLLPVVLLVLLLGVKPGIILKKTEQPVARIYESLRS